MAKKLKKFLKKAAKAALIGGGLYAAAKGLKGAKGNVSKTAAMEDIITRPSRVDDYNYTPKTYGDTMWDTPWGAKAGGSAKRGVGIAKRGFGRALKGK